MFLNTTASDIAPLRLLPPFTLRLSFKDAKLISGVKRQMGIQFSIIVTPGEEETLSAEPSYLSLALRAQEQT